MKTVLALDGGGIRGTLTARVLVELERRLGPLAHAFDLISGTSTGGILACGIGAKLSAQALLDLYAKRGAEIFSRSAEWVARTVDGITGPKYPAEALERILRETLGDATLSSSASRILVPSYATELPRSARKSITPEAGAYFWKSWVGPDAFLRDVARSTSAAPTYFPPYRFANFAGEAAVYTDGGTCADSPGLCAYAEARALWPGERIVLIAVGTGLEQIDFPGMDDAGLIEWARALPSIFMDGQCDIVDYQLRTLLADDYLRLDIDLGDASADIDDASAGNISRLLARAEALIADPTIAVRLGQFTAERTVPA